MTQAEYDVVGIGAGPFNLSVAALLHQADIRQCFFEKQEQFCWHPGMLLPNTTIQNSFLKDLVSLADPTSAFSFLAFLHDQKRLYQYVNAGFQRTSRQEYNQYLQWVARRLPAVQWGRTVRQVKRHPRGFEVGLDGASCVAHNLIVGTGPRPAIPAMAEPFLGEHVFHSSQYLFKRDQLLLRRVAVIGGGQSGAEIVLNLLNHNEAPLEITWLSARESLAPIDESHFANEWFTPAYIGYFWGLDADKKRQLLAQHTLASDGISPETIEALYQTLYRIRFLDQGSKCRLMHSRLVNAIHHDDHGYRLDMTHLDSRREQSVAVDRIVLATGYRQDNIPAVLADLAGDLDYANGDPVVNLDFSLKYRGQGKIFVLNASRHSHGISEPNLSANAWRAATIVNAVLGYERYPSPHLDSMLELACAGVLEEAN